MRLLNEEQILDIEFRKQVLTELRSSENVARKNEHLKRYEVYKDQTSKYVEQALLKEGLLSDTIAAMINRAGNVSFCRKIVNKLARAYSGGTQRIANPTSAQQQVDDMARMLHFDSKMKKADRYRELQRNGMLYVGPELNSEHSMPEKPVYDLKIAVMAPWQYDVIEDCYDREKPRVVIISNFTEQTTAQPSTEQKAGIHPGKTSSVVPFTNRKDDIIADAPSDAGQGNVQEFVWWSTKYHFTTDQHGNYLGVGTKTPPDFANPIQYLPLVNNADEQDGQFWARGGNDLIDGSILINKLMTDMNFISYLQGYGQYVVTGKDITRERFRFGPNNAIVLEYDPEKQEPKPEVQVVSANPPIESWMKMVEQQVALLLTTNNLSPANVSGTLSAQTFPSGIAMLVEQSEATDDITDKQGEYKDIERRMWEALKRWQNLYVITGALSPDFAAVGAMPEALEVSVKFVEPKPVVTEGEKLANIEKRKDLGINTMVDLVRIDNPDLTEDEALEKLAKISDEKTARAALVVSVGDEDEEETEDDTEPKEPERVGEQDAD